MIFIVFGLLVFLVAIWPIFFLLPFISNNLVDFSMDKGCKIMFICLPAYYMILGVVWVVYFPFAT